MFLEPLSKCSRGFSYILPITLHPTTFVTVDDPTLLQHRIFVLRGHQEVFDGCASSEVNLYPIVVTFLLHTLTQPLVIWYCYIRFLAGILQSGAFVVVFLLGWFFSFLSSLFSAHMGYLQFISALERCSSSCCNNCLLEHMVFAL